MTVAQNTRIAEPAQHIVLDGVSWDLYEQMVKELGNQHVRMTYDEGRLEIMSPLSKHERWGAWIARLIELMCLERSMHVEPLGSTTFKDQMKDRGLEPDECFYVQHADKAQYMEEAYDPTVDLPPDLAVEIDITRRSIDREPIYASLGVPELWRFNGDRLEVLHLSSGGGYVHQSASLAFPFLRMADFERYVLRRLEHEQLRVLREFREWVRTLT